MSQDVLLKIQSDGSYDIEVEDGRLKEAGGFETAIPISLFTDTRAPSSRVPDARRRRGWIGNLPSADTGRELGSLLWLLDQARVVNDTLNEARDFAQGGLDWLLEDGALSEVRVAVDRLSTREIAIFVTLVRPDNSVAEYSTLWRRTDAAQLPFVR